MEIVLGLGFIIALVIFMVLLDPASLLIPLITVPFILFFLNRKEKKENAISEEENNDYDDDNYDNYDDYDDGNDYDEEDYDDDEEDYYDDDEEDYDEKNDEDTETDWAQCQTDDHGPEYATLSAQITTLNNSYKESYDNLRKKKESEDVSSEELHNALEKLLSIGDSVCKVTETANKFLEDWDNYSEEERLKLLETIEKLSSLTTKLSHNYSMILGVEEKDWKNEDEEDN